MECVAWYDAVNRETITSPVDAWHREIGFI